MRTEETADVPIMALCRGLRSLRIDIEFRLRDYARALLGSEVHLRTDVRIGLVSVIGPGDTSVLQIDDSWAARTFYHGQPVSVPTEALATPEAFVAWYRQMEIDAAEVAAKREARKADLLKEVAEVYGHHHAEALSRSLRTCP